MIGKHVLITGGARGMGRITALSLAKMGASIIIADWEGEHGNRTVAEIRANGGDAEFLYCNVASLPSVRILAEKIMTRHARLDVLINNAGITYPRRQENEDGIEMHFATCHLGHFLLTQLLLDRLKETASQHGEARILFIASEGHKACKGLDFEDINNEALWKGRAVNHSAAFMAYARAKLCMLYTMLELNERLQGTGVTSNAVSPGFFINTGIHREMRGVFELGAMLVFGLGKLLGISTAKKGARTHIWLASAAEVQGVSGKYFEHCREKAMSPQAGDLGTRKKLWTLSEHMTGLGT